MPSGQECHDCKSSPATNPPPSSCISANDCPNTTVDNGTTVSIVLPLSATPSPPTNISSGLASFLPTPTLLDTSSPGSSSSSPLETTPAVSTNDTSSTVSATVLTTHTTHNDGPSLTPTVVSVSSPLTTIPAAQSSSATPPLPISPTSPESSAPTTPPDSQAQPVAAVASSSHKRNAGAIAGGVIGGLAFLALLVLAVLFRKRLFNRLRRHRTAPSAEFMNHPALHADRHTSTPPLLRGASPFVADDEQPPPFTRGSYNDPVFEKISAAQTQWQRYGPFRDVEGEPSMAELHARD